ncbi:putative salicylate hydroxylase [Actinomycetospora sp. NBRC 106375]|uniref:FAD-dependent oxidoreductase n=1 Tax=Actinomycetospora sp. NBRC 106375 TaxID=3032207 RepID=UPI0024A0BBE6|nr:FAD-dependent monooxygenase [Actinomycetospora sp. NBRC 106375]GLZ47575.1 putative salicylate hydroxylase [Actinomycetospora sp. NBRC 106375]
MTGLRVAVVGGGIGGATAALALRRHGVDVAVYERRDTVPPVGSGLGLAGNGYRVLADLGLGPALDATGAPISAMLLLGPDGTEIARYDTGRLLGMRRADLVRIVLDGLGTGVVHHGRECVAVDVGSDTGSDTGTDTGTDTGAGTGAGTDTGTGTTRPVVRFADGSSTEADVVVVADGLRSRVAAAVATRPPLRPSGMSALRGFIDGRGLPGHLAADQNAWLGADRHLLSYPVDQHGTVNFAAFVPRPAGSADEWSFRVDPEVVRGAFAGWDPDTAAILAQAREVYRYDLADRDPFAPWARAGVVLLGDAAHPMLPHMGQGANQAIEDGAVLAALLDEAGGPADVADRLAAYEATRRPRTDRVQGQSRRNGERFAGARHPTSGGENDDLSWVYGYDAPAAGRDAAAAFRPV